MRAGKIRRETVAVVRTNKKRKRRRGKAVAQGRGARGGREETMARGREDGEREPSGDQPDDTASAPAESAATDAANGQNGTTKRTSSGVLFDFSGVKSSPPDPKQTPQERTQETGGMYDDDFHTDSPFLPYFRGLPLTTGYAEGGLYVRRFGFFRRSPEKARADGENKRERRGRDQERGGTRKRVRERLTFRARYSMIKTETKVTNKWRNFL